MANEQTLIVRPPIWAILAAVVIGGLFYISGKNIETSHTPEPRGTISVSGEGKVTMVPDIGELNFGFQTGRQPTAAAAMELLAKNMNAVVAAVKAQDVEEKDIMTQQLYLNPIYDWTENGQIFRGFEASQSLRVKVRDLDSVSDVLAAATEAGANQAGGISFTIDDPEAKQAEARQMAIEDAKEKAEVLADQLNVQLGDIVNFSENGGGWMPPVMMRTEAYGMGGGGDAAVKMETPLPPGEQEIVSNVTITYELE